jgi:hypothetical protein
MEQRRLCVGKGVMFCSLSPSDSFWDMADMDYSKEDIERLASFYRDSAFKLNCLR